MQLPEADQQKITDAVFVARDRVADRYADLASDTLASESLKRALATHLNMALAISDMPLSIDERLSMARHELREDQAVDNHTRAAAIKIGEKLVRSGLHIAQRETLRYH